VGWEEILMSGSILQWMMSRLTGRELSIQQLSQTRKFIYLGLILVLFTVAWGFRHYSVEPQAEKLALREQDVGDVELSGSAIRLSLTGLRGVATCVLWINAMEKQKKNQWDELEILVNSVTKLQPHFITPWLFQSWNLSYNVAVKCDLPRDKYFYISRGLDLLAEGERQNQGDPDLRFAMGTYYQQKICNADHKVPLQALFELSFIDPVHRDRAWLSEKGDDGRPRFETFLCEQHPRLIRRLRENLDFTSTKKVLDFLEENSKIPSLYGEKVDDDGDARHTQLKKNKEKPFPVVPTPWDPSLGRRRTWDPDQVQSLEEIEGEYDAFAAARAWYQYAQEALPRPSKSTPGASEEVAERFRQRLPRHLTTVIFRDYPARAQSYVGERLEEDGWFDESGWKITGWFPQDQFSNGKPAVVGTGRKWAADAWNKAFDMWREYGEINLMLKSPEELQDFRLQAEKFIAKHNLAQGQMPNQVPVQDRNDPGWQAWNFIYDYDYYRHLTNFPHHYFRAQAEMQPDMIQARKDLFEAEQLRLKAKSQALPRYEQALQNWRDKVLGKNPELMNDEMLLEDLYEGQLNYVQFFNESPQGRVLKQGLFVEAALGQAGIPGVAEQLLSLSEMLRPQAIRSSLLVGPLDGKLPDGTRDCIDPLIRQRLLVRKGLAKAAPPAGMIMGPGGRPMFAPGAGPGGIQPLPPPAPTAGETVIPGPRKP
jgi:hypothetical protein